MQESAKYQYLAAATVNILVATCGVGVGWTSASGVILMSDDTPLQSGKISIEEMSWVVSLWYIGGFFGNIIFGFLTNHFGRKIPLIFMAIPKSISWIIILYAPNIYYLFVARLLYGMVVGGTMVVVPLYFAEISSDRIRGAIGSTKMLIFNFGVFLAFLLGNYFDYFMTPKVMVVMLVVYIVVFFFFPESPTVLVKQNKIKQAENAIRFYRSIPKTNSTSDYVQNEIERLQNSLQKINKSDKSSFNWSDLAVNPGRKAVIIGSVLAMLLPLCGVSTIAAYAAHIFADSGSALTPNMSAVVVGLMMLLGSIAATFLIEWSGRRMLYIVSTIGTSGGLSTLSIYLMLQARGYDVNAFNWLPIVSISFVVFIASCAILNLAFVVISEIMPEQLKNFGASLSLTLKWIFGFFIAKYFPFFMALLELHGAMFVFASFCLFGAVFVIQILPETKGKSYEQIMDLIR